MPEAVLKPNPFEVVLAKASVGSVKTNKVQLNFHNTPGQVLIIFSVRPWQLLEPSTPPHSSLVVSLKLSMSVQLDIYCACSQYFLILAHLFPLCLIVYFNFSLPDLKSHTNTLGLGSFLRQLPQSLSCLKALIISTAILVSLNCLLLAGLEGDLKASKQANKNEPTTPKTTQVSDTYETLFQSV